MNIIIVGDGKVGEALARQLSAEGHDITMVDSDPQVLTQSADRMDIMAVVGNGASMATLREAGAEHAGLLIAATSRDELNLLTCLTAKNWVRPTPSPAFATPSIPTSWLICTMSWAFPSPSTLNTPPLWRPINSFSSPLF